MLVKLMSDLSSTIKISLILSYLCESIHFLAKSREKSNGAIPFPSLQHNRNVSICEKVLSLSDAILLSKNLVYSQ